MARSAGIARDEQCDVVLLVFHPAPDHLQDAVVDFSNLARRELLEGVAQAFEAELLALRVARFGHAVGVQQEDVSRREHGAAVLLLFFWRLLEDPRPDAGRRDLLARAGALPVDQDILVAAG